MAEASRLLELARRLELTELSATSDSVVGKYRGLEVWLHGEERLEAFSVMLGFKLELVRLAGRRGDLPHVDEVLTGSDALQALLKIRAVAGRASAVRLVFADHEVREVLRELALAHDDLVIDGERLTVGVGEDPGHTLQQAVKLVELLRQRSVATEALSVTSEEPVKLPGDSFRELLARLVFGEK